MRALVMAVAGLACWSAPARACGTWQMHDLDLSRWVSFHAANTLISKANRKKGPHKLIQRLSGRGREIHSLMGQARDFHFEGNTLRRGKRVVAHLEGNTIKFEYLRFRLDVTPKPDKERRLYRVELHLGQKLVAAGDAMPTCGSDGADPPPSKEALAREQEEIRRRVVLYLAWRRLVRKR